MADSAIGVVVVVVVVVVGSGQDASGRAKQVVVPGHPCIKQNIHEMKYET